MLSLAATKVDIGDRFNAIRLQERSAYRCCDYFSPEFQAKQAEQFAKNPLNHFILGLDTGSSVSSSSRTKINECWREKICEWSYQVIDHFDLNREIVSISLSYLDRYLCTCPVNRNLFQLAGMTSLFLAIKLYQPSNVKISSFVELSRGYFSIDHIIAMEAAILRYVLCFVLIFIIPTCKWHVCSLFYLETSISRTCLNSRLFFFFKTCSGAIGHSSGMFILRRHFML